MIWGEEGGIGSKSSKAMSTSQVATTPLTMISTSSSRVICSNIHNKVEFAELEVRSTAQQQLAEFSPVCPCRSNFAEISATFHALSTGRPSPHTHTHLPPAYLSHAPTTSFGCCTTRAAGSFAIHLLILEQAPVRAGGSRLGPGSTCPLTCLVSLLSHLFLLAFRK